jgi:hypothetical protein
LGFLEFFFLFESLSEEELCLLAGWLADEAAELMALPGAEERLELTQLAADLMDYGSLVEVFKGCVGVFHTTSPSDLVSNYPVRKPSLSLSLSLSLSSPIPIYTTHLTMYKSFRALNIKILLFRTGLPGGCLGVFSEFSCWEGKLE